MFSSFSGSFRAGRRPKKENSAPLWTPSDISPDAWIDASDTNSYTVNGSSELQTSALASKQYDKSGNFNMQVDGTPTRLIGLNGLYVFDFDGSESLISAAGGTYANNGNHWAIGVYQWHSITTTKDSFWSADASTRSYAVSASTTADKWLGEIDYDGANTITGGGHARNTFYDSTDPNPPTSIAKNTWAIISIVFNKSGNQIFGRINGVLETDIHPYSKKIDNNCTDLRMMRNRSGKKQDGRMAEYFHKAGVAGTGGTDISDVEKAEGYLAHKWGLESNLPNTHPYKNSAPTQ